MEVSEDTVREIYPDMDDEEIATLMEEITSGDYDFQQLIEDSNDAKVYLDWDWMDEDDWWTDRKGGYDVTFALNADTSVEKDSTDLNTEFAMASQDTTEMLPVYPAGEYTIRIWGRTREIGVHKIKKAQYDHWIHEDNEDSLSDALNENYDYDENETPKTARFDQPYYEYQDKHSFWGFDEDDTRMTIENSEGEEIYEGDLASFISEAHGDNDSRWEATEEQEELYPEYLGKGYWLMWTQGGKGSCIQTTIDTNGEEFDPRKLHYTTWDVQGSGVVNRLLYDGEDLSDEGMDSEHDNWRGQWSEFNIYHNTK
jgi:hypothetical protein